MKVLVIVLFLLQILFAQTINQKMIISAHFETEEATQDLYEIENFFQENAEAYALKEKYNLLLGMELLEAYVLVTVKPITLVSVKNKLHYLLQAKFPQNFIVDNTFIRVQPKLKKVERSKEKKEVFIPSKETPIEMLSRVKQFLDDLNSEWLGLILLALAGFLLVYRSAKRMSKIKKLQNEVSGYQSKIEGEINYIGKKNV